MMTMMEFWIAMRKIVVFQQLGQTLEQVWEAPLSDNLKVRISFVNGSSGGWGGITNITNFSRNCNDNTYASDYEPLSNVGNDALQFNVLQGSIGNTFTVTYLDNANMPVVVDNPRMHLGGLGGSYTGPFTFTVGASDWSLLSGASQSILSLDGTDFAGTSTTIYHPRLGLNNGAAVNDCASGEGSATLQIQGDVSSFTYTVDMNGATLDQMIVMFEGCALLDTDMDGITNDCDKDSDGDGCPDATESGAGLLAGSQISYSDSMVIGGVDTYGIPLLVSDGLGGVNYSITNNFITSGDCLENCCDGIDNNFNMVIDDAILCPDKDGDGVADFCDLDDDNDGILDTTEGVISCNGVYSWTNLSFTEGNPPATLPGAFTITGSANDGILTPITGSVTLNAQNEANDFGMTFNANGSITNTNLSGSGVNDSLQYTIAYNQPTNMCMTWQGGIFDDVEDYTITYTAIGSTITGLPIANLSVSTTSNSYFFNTSVDVSNTNMATLEVCFTNLTSITIKRKDTAAGGAESAWRFRIPLTCINDTDMDGLSDHCDLDSDGDGCPDATESGAGLLAGSQVSYADSTVTGGVDAFGIPLLVSNGSGGVNYTPTTNAITPGDCVENCCDGIDNDFDQLVDFTDNVDCPDKDMDGAPDMCDLDNDNDGILDIDEGLNIGVDTLDTDSDGTPDYCDLDSDNDGCPDAIEAGHDNVLYPDSTISGPFGANGLSDGAETAPESGISNYSIQQTTPGINDFQNSNVQDINCATCVFSITAPDTAGCSGVILPTFTVDTVGGTWSVISSIGTTVNGAGQVTLGFNGSPTPNMDTIIYTLDAMCADTAFVIVFPTPTIKITATDDPNNCNNSPGSITVMGTGGTGIYEFSLNGTTWVSNGTNMITLSNVNAGNYTPLVRNLTSPVGGEAACPTSDTSVTLTVGQANFVLDSLIAINSINCLMPNGSVGIYTTNTSGTPILYYNFSGNTTNTKISGVTANPDWKFFTGDTILANIVPGTYLVTVAQLENGMGNDDVQCLTQEVVTITAPQAPTISEIISTNPTDCADTNGTIRILASGIGGPISYSIDGINFQPDSLFESLSAGTYSVYVRNVNATSCADTAMVTLVAPIAPVINSVATINPDDCNAANGKITVNATGTGNTILYSIDGINYQTNNMFSNLVDGPYNLYIRYSNIAGCGDTTMVTLSDPIAPSIVSIAGLNPSDCNNNDGQITISAGSGIPPYRYSIDGGATWFTDIDPYVFLGLSGGTYNVRVANADTTCIQSGSVVLTAPKLPIINAVSSLDPNNCGASNGSITITAMSDGVNMLSYSIDNGVTWQSSNVFSSLSAGLYEIIVAYNNGSICQVVGPVLSLNDPTPPTLLPAMVTQLSDCGEMDGIITVLAVGGEGPLMYSLISPIMAGPQTSPVFTGLGAGTYTYQVTNNDGSCIQTGMATINMILGPSFDGAPVVTNETGCDLNNGSITINAIGGMPPYQYSINGGASWTTSNIFTSLIPGTYDVLIRNGNGTCQTAPVTVVINSIELPIITSAIPVAPANCGINGTINLAVSGGTGTYEYSINGTTWIAFLSPVSISLPDGSYMILVRNAGIASCQVMSGKVLLQSPPAPAIIETDLQSPTDCGLTDGTISIVATQGDTSSFSGIMFRPYQFSIDGGMNWTLATIGDTAIYYTGIDPNDGPFAIQVRNFDGTCVSVVFPPLEMDTLVPVVITNILANDPSDCGVSDGSISIFATGEFPIEYSINGGSTWTTSKDFLGLAGGTYTVLARYFFSEDCPTTPQMITLNTPMQPTVAVVVTPISICDADDASIVITATPATSNLLYSIDGGDNYVTGNVFNNLTAGSYEVVVNNLAGACEVPGGTFVINPGPCIEVTKSLSSVLVQPDGNVKLTFDFEITNTGGTTLDSLQLTDLFEFTPLTTPLMVSVSNGSADILPAPSLTFTGIGQNNLFDGISGSFKPGQSFNASVMAIVDPVAFSMLMQPVENQATITGQPKDEMGNAFINPATGMLYAVGEVNDLSDDNTPANPDGGSPNDPTPIDLPGNIEVTKSLINLANPPASNIDGNVDATYEFVIYNTGADTLSQVYLSDNIFAEFGAGFVGVVNTPSISMSVSEPGSINPTPLASYTGYSPNTVLANNGKLVPGDSVVVQITVELDLNQIPNPASNQAIACGNDQNNAKITDLSDNTTPGDPNDPENQDEPTPFPPTASIATTKALTNAVYVNDTTYEMTFVMKVQNVGTDSLQTLPLVDNLDFNILTSTVSVIKQPTVGTLTSNGSEEGGTFIGTGPSPGNRLTLGVGTAILEPGDYYELEVKFTATVEELLMFDPLNNQTIAFGTGLSSGVTVSDLSDR
ncbi:MAG: SprB repeat-containing protein [Saprospiraceae bacterium]|nr:SprB repeat-containing protein [Saprospiraceae bacterium]